MLNILECTPIAQFAIGMDHKITHWNRACKLLTGLSAAEMLGTDRQWEPFYDKKRIVLADLIIENDFNQFLQIYEGKSAAKSKIVPNAWEATDFFPNMGGKQRHIYFLAAPIFDNKGNISGAVTTLQDITEQKRLEMAIKKESELLHQENLTLKSSIKERFKFNNIIGKSQAMQNVYEMILKTAATNVNAIIYGESGTGKELVARAIHDVSGRHNKKFLPVNCAAIPETLIENEFFGHKKGAFTGADTDKEGYFDKAKGGTLFLDEVGELDLNIQAKLLRTIEGGGYSPVGSTKVKKSDVRIIAATNRDLEEQVKKGLMRKDFFYRIHIIPIHLPPLRDRKGDIPLIADYFLQTHDKDKKLYPVPGKVIEALCNYDWPGNVRELQNVLLRYLTLKRLDFMKTPSIESFDQNYTSNENQFVQTGRKIQDLQSAIKDFEKKLIARTLEQNQWHREKAASVLGISRRTLFRKIKELGIK